MITKITKEYPRTRSKAAGQTSTIDSMMGQREPGTPSRTVGLDMSRLSVFKPLAVSTYNVRTLYQRGQTYQLFMGCNDAGIDIAGVQEHRLITPSSTAQLQTKDMDGLDL